MRAAGIAALFCLCTASARAQRVRGDLHLRCMTGGDRGVANRRAGQRGQWVSRTFVAGPKGRYVAQDLPFGVYRLSLQGGRIRS